MVGQMHGVKKVKSQTKIYSNFTANPGSVLKLIRAYHTFKNPFKAGIFINFLGSF